MGARGVMRGLLCREQTCVRICADPTQSVTQRTAVEIFPLFITLMKCGLQLGLQSLLLATSFVHICYSER